MCYSRSATEIKKTFKTGIQAFLQLSAQLALLLLHVLAATHSHLQGATNVEDMYCVLCSLSNIHGRIFIHADDVHKCTLDE
jgi:hypothetical protein